MNVLLLVIAIALNVMANYCMKKIYLENDTPIVSLFFALSFLALSFVCYTLALRNIPISSAYTLLTGGSLLGITAVGVFVFGESINVNIILGLVFVLIGIITISLGVNEIG